MGPCPVLVAPKDVSRLITYTSSQFHESHSLWRTGLHACRAHNAAG